MQGQHIKLADGRRHIGMKSTGGKDALYGKEGE
jgi:hypothetical protein